jgi:hypothetical protein
MSLDRSGPYAARRDSEPAEQTVGDVIENAVRKIVTSVVVAGGFVALAIYFQAPPRYQAAVGDGRVVRIDTRTGTVIACDAQGCAVVLRRGQRLEERSNLNRLPKQDVQPASAVPAPAAQPALPAPATKAPAAQAVEAPDEE